MQRPPLRILVFFLALLMGTGAVMPAPGLWQCCHASRIVTAPVLQSGAMPCRMGGGMMSGTMTCCLAKRQPRVSGAKTAQTVSPLPCRPTFVRLSSFPIARIGQAPPSPTDTAASAHALFLSAEGVVPTRPAVSARQRPPPASLLTLSDLLHVPGLRAPPVA